jgi:transcriptional regulator with XRE-family HTH domain
MPRAGPPTLARQLGARIRALRTEAKLTQEQLAWECDLAKPYLSRVEAGKRTPSVPVLALLATRLGVELADVVALDPTQPRLALLEAARKGDGEAVRVALQQLDLVELVERPEPDPGTTPVEIADAPAPTKAPREPRR